MTRCVQWSESRGPAGESEMFFVTAEPTATGWQFFERSAWEIRWFSITPTPERIAHAEALSRPRPDPSS